MKPTTEQQAIIAAARSGSNLVIQAGAGTGKTSTLRMVAGELRRPTLYIAYNRSIAQEATGSFPKHVECRTAHSLAMRAVGWRYRHRLSGGRQTSKRAAEVLSTPWLEIDQSRRISPVQMARIALGTVQRFCYSADDEIAAWHVPQQNGVLGEDHDYLARSVLPYAQRAWDDICAQDGALRFEHDHY